MTTLLFTLVLAAPAQQPASEPDAKQLAAWVADLSGSDAAKSGVAREALIKAGPKAKAFVPDLIKLLTSKDDRLSWGMTHAVAILGAIGPDAKDAVPALMALCKVQGYSSFPADLGYAIARIDGPKPEVTR